MRKIVQRTKRFEKSFLKLTQTQKNLFLRKLSKFIDHENDPSLKTHKLQGKLKKHYAFSITDDVRAIFRKEVQKREEVIIFTFIDIGGHNKVYG